MGAREIEQRRVAIEGATAGDEVVEHHACGVDVRALIDLPAPRLFRREKPRRAHRDALGRREGQRQRRLVAHHADHLRDPEIQHLQRASPALRVAEEQVVELHVAVDDARVVRRGEAREGLAHHVDRLEHGHEPPRLELLAHRFPAEQLHHEERASLGGLSEIGHLHQVRVRDLRERLRLDPHPIDVVRAARVPLLQELDDHALAERDVLDLDHVAHASAAERRDEPVGRAFEQARLDGWGRCARSSGRRRRIQGAGLLLRRAHESCSMNTIFTPAGATEFGALETPVPAGAESNCDKRAATARMSAKASHTSPGAQSCAKAILRADCGLFGS